MTTHSTSRLAVHGGTPVRKRPFPEWPTSATGDTGSHEDIAAGDTSDRKPSDVVARFEAEFAAYHEAHHCICVCNRTLAMATALKAAEVGPGDEVVVTPYASITAVAAVIFIGAVPVFADIDPGTHLLDPDAAEAAITVHTKAVVPFHLAGRPCDLDAFTRLGEIHRIAVVEDASHAQGAEWHGRKLGAIGDIGAFGLHTSTCTPAGDAGALTTDDTRLAECATRLARSGRIRSGRGSRRPGDHDHRQGLRPSEAQAKALRIQLARYPRQLETRTANAQRLRRSLKRVRGIGLPPENPGITAHANHGFVFRLTHVTCATQRDAFVEMLTAEGIPCTRGYGGLHRNPALRAEIACLAERLHRPYTEPEVPVTDQAVADTVWLPPHVLLGTEADTHDVSSAILKVHAAQQTGTP